MRIAGPIWNGALHDAEFASTLLDHVLSHKTRYGTAKRMAGILTMICEELPEVPLFYSKDKLFSAVKCVAPKITTVASALLNAGYTFSLSHCFTNSIKTNAPSSFVWDVVRQYECNNPIDKNKIPESCQIILSKTISHSGVSFNMHPSANPPSRETKLTRFQLNPPNWGPGARPKNPVIAKRELELTEDPEVVKKVAKTELTDSLPALK